MPSLTQLEYILAVERLRHFGQAARACHVSQPSLSMQLRKAEDELGVVIFDREKKPVVPTVAGLAVIEQARQVLREHQRLLQVARGQSEAVAGDLRLGVIPTIAPYLVPRFIDGFSADFPAARLAVDEMKTEDIIVALRNDTLDAAILATPLREKGLDEEPLFYEPFYLYAPPEHALMRKRTVKEGDLDGSELWLLKDGHCLRNQIVNFCSLGAGGPGVYHNVAFEGGTLETLRYLIRSNGRGYTIVPHLFVALLPAAERAASVRPFAPPVPTREVSLVVRRGQWKGRLTAAVAGAVRKSVPKEILEHTSRQTVVDL